MLKQLELPINDFFSLKNRVILEGNLWVHPEDVEEAYGGKYYEYRKFLSAYPEGISAGNILGLIWKAFEFFDPGEIQCFLVNTESVELKRVVWNVYEDYTTLMNYLQNKEIYPYDVDDFSEKDIFYILSGKWEHFKKEILKLIELDLKEVNIAIEYELERHLNEVFSSLENFFQNYIEDFCYEANIHYYSVPYYGVDEIALILSEQADLNSLVLYLVQDILLKGYDEKIVFEYLWKVSNIEEVILNKYS